MCLYSLVISSILISAFPRTHYLLAGEGIVYFILAAVDLSAHVMPGVRNSLATFRSFDIAVGESNAVNSDCSLTSFRYTGNNPFVTLHCVPIPLRDATPPQHFAETLSVCCEIHTDALRSRRPSHQPVGIVRQPSLS